MGPTPIKLIGGHLDDPPEWASELIYAVGVAMLHWGRLEQHLDTLLISVNKEAFSKGAFTKTPSTSFRLKLDLFKRWFVKDPRFSELADLARPLWRYLCKLSDDRVLLAHSNLQEFVEGPPSRMIVINVHVEGENVRMSRGDWTQGQLIDFFQKIQKANRGLAEISHRYLNPDFLRSLEST